MMTPEQDRIKRRVRALLNMTAGNGAADGEIDTAMRLAETLMNQYHLDRADVEAREADTVGTGAGGNQPMGMAEAVSRTASLSTWESALAWAVVELIGSLGWYRTQRVVPTGLFGKPETRNVIKFYGPADDAAMASELFAEWSGTIATMAVGRYSGCFRGDGAQYAYGFSRRLYERAKEAKAQRAMIATDATRALVKVGTGGTLAAVLDAKRQQGRAWLATQGIHLGSSGGGRRRGYSGSHDAYSAGRADGSRAEFSATRRRKLTA